ncbi:PREDICTED: uncharacterized protein LOC104809985 [Tarenaya hassleriana]|uniref:uncharacterized protein LOC104809985 n=1 Tax=Tarenaya hassleriana TaxID=28532 RepID=UPI00053C09B8|nr:PREDICTED: uncharacterized protein LOC104809985 [Tarenaya hassleriana]
MGGCVSVGRSECESSPTAKIVTVNGDLREYNVPVLASQVLEAESAASSSSRSTSYFICNSDSLYYDDFIPAIGSDEQLQADQIYFVLPISKRQNRLTAPDMAALAVKASVAIKNAAGKESRRRKKGRISPVVVLSQPSDTKGSTGESTVYKGIPAKKTAPTKVSGGFSRSGSVRKLQRYTSRRAKLAVRSFRLRLSTIYEGSIL